MVFNCRGTSRTSTLLPPRMTIKYVPGQLVPCIFIHISKVDHSKCWFLYSSKSNLQCQNHLPFIEKRALKLPRTTTMQLLRTLVGKKLVRMLRKPFLQIWIDFGRMEWCVCFTFFRNLSILILLMGIGIVLPLHRCWGAEQLSTEPTKQGSKRRQRMAEICKCRLRPQPKR